MIETAIRTITKQDKFIIKNSIYLHVSLIDK